MDDELLTATRRSLHAVAELLIAGPQHRAHATIRLRVSAGGFAGVAVPLRVEGTDLVWDGGSAPLTGTFRGLAQAAGVTAGPPEGVYADTSGVEPDEEIHVDAAAAARLAEWFARGEAGLRAFAPESEPVLWPEHFDLAISEGEVNYGVSPGDATHPEPYAYVGPWTPREGPFWNASFGAVRAASEFANHVELAGFFADGRIATTG